MYEVTTLASQDAYQVFRKCYCLYSQSGMCLIITYARDLQIAKPAFVQHRALLGGGPETPDQEPYG